MKSVRDMTDEEFKAYTGWTREQARSIMLAHRFSPIPERPMHPKARISSPEPISKDAESKFLQQMEEDNVTENKTSETLQ